MVVLIYLTIRCSCGNSGVHLQMKERVRVIPAVHITYYETCTNHLLF